LQTVPGLATGMIRKLQLDTQYESMLIAIDNDDYIEKVNYYYYYKYKYLLLKISIL
jgi:hypothetical protein